MMTLEEAIRHAEQVADSYKDTAPDCSCAVEHRQLAAWLKELKRLKENGPDMVSKEKVLQILHECIVGPEIDEDDSAVVDYRMAKNAVVKMDVESNSMLRPGDVVWFHGTCGIVTKAKRQDPHVARYDVVASSGGMLQVIDDDRAEHKYRICYIGPHIDLSAIRREIMKAYDIASSRGLRMEEEDDI